MFWPFDDDTLKIPVLVSGLKKMTTIIRVVIKFLLQAGIMLDFVRSSIIFNES